MATKLKSKMFIVYDLIFIVFAILYFPYVLLHRKWHKNFLTRLGFLPKDLKSKLSGGRNIWIHAVSVGEVMAVLGMVDKIKQAFPGHEIVLSTVTTTGYQLASSKLVSPDMVIYAPLDFSPVVRNYIVCINPVVYITAETEIWPNLLYAMKKKNVPVILVNGRISQKSFSRYAGARFLLAPILRSIKLFCMQTSEDARRIIALGAAADCVHSVGNMKFDDFSSAESFYSEESSDQPVWVAGSTHPGEEQIVLDVFKQLKKEFPALRLIVAPRHVDRTAEVMDLVTKAGFAPVKFSQLSGSSPQAEVVIVDTIGHLRVLYKSATIVFVGKSFTGQGGQNIIEPAFYGKPIIIGPHMENFKSVTALFLNAQAIVQLKQPDELFNSLIVLLKNPQQAAALGQRAKALIETQQGATQRTIDFIHKLLIS